MAQNATSDDGREKISAVDVDEGDRVFMAVSPHGSIEDKPALSYDDELFKSGIEGTVVEALSDDEKAILEHDDYGRPLADVVVESDEGETAVWNVDNGYVISQNDSIGRSTDVGKFAGFYEL